MGVDRDRTRGNERSGGKREREREGSMFNMTSKYLITSVTMSASQTRLPFSHIHQPSVLLCLQCADVKLGFDQYQYFYCLSVTLLIHYSYRFYSQSFSVKNNHMT